MASKKFLLQSLFKTSSQLKLGLDESFIKDLPQNPKTKSKTVKLAILNLTIPWNDMIMSQRYTWDNAADMLVEHKLCPNLMEHLCTFWYTGVILRICRFNALGYIWAMYRWRSVVKYEPYPINKTIKFFFFVNWLMNISYGHMILKQMKKRKLRWAYLILRKQI